MIRPRLASLSLFDSFACGRLTKVNFFAQGVVGTSAGTLWYVNWPEQLHIRLVSSHTDQVGEAVAKVSSIIGKVSHSRYL